MPKCAVAKKVSRKVTKIGSCYRPLPVEAEFEQAGFRVQESLTFILALRHEASGAYCARGNRMAVECYQVVAAPRS